MSRVHLSTQRSSTRHIATGW